MLFMKEEFTLANSSDGKTFRLKTAPIRNSEQVYLNGELLRKGDLYDYDLTVRTLILANPITATDYLVVVYYAV